MPGKKILLVEDDRAIQVLIKTILEKAGYQVYAAFDAMQGLMAARQQAPDLIILDMMMPAGGGASVFERVRNLASTSATPILIYSALDAADIAKKVPADPLIRVLRKPAPPAAVLAAARELLGEPPAAA